ncbi:MAG: hypothetical protein CMF96_09685 [Candidatus Marinimicrobia bacterium]|nr:hypothetical protein [Candidatus Neomarinimicrobiota bacterium]|tara:strand:- start:4400 stop:5164 length:765 start_codon:yes stop_codon:yes gene_type:complete
MINITKLHEIGLLIMKSIDSSKIFNEIISVIQDAVQFEYATIFISKIGNNLEPAYSLNNIIVDLASDFNVGNGSGIAGWVSDNNNPVIFPNFMNDNPNREFNSFVSIPLVIDEKRIGVLNLGHSSPNYFNKKDKLNFLILGSQVAIILDKMDSSKQINAIKSEYNDVMNLLNETEKKLAEKEKLAIIGQSAKSINKEINNPLSVIIGFANLLINKCKADNIETEFLSEKLEIILDSAKKIDTIVHHYENYKSNK